MITPRFQFPELSNKDLLIALKLAYLNVDSLRPEAQPEFRKRIRALEAEVIDRANANAKDPDWSKR